MTTDTLNKVQDEASINDTRKAQLLSSTVEHIDITSFDARPIVEAMGKMSFTSRDLARATDLYNQMLADPNCSVILVIAGSTSAGGCMDLYAELVRNNMVDAIVATGAAIVDMDFFEALGHKHYQARDIPDDDTLRSLYIDRIYDTYIDEIALQDCDFTIGNIAEFSAAITNLWGDPDRCGSMGLAGREWAKAYLTKATYIAKLLAAYRDAQNIVAETRPQCSNHA